MKTKIYFLFAFTMLFTSIISKPKTLPNIISEYEDSICVYSTPDLFILTSNWVKEYWTINPNVKIKLSKIKDLQDINGSSKGGYLCFMSNDYSSNNNGTKWRMVVGMDAIVPIFNSKNPYIDEINQKGISPDKIAQFIKDPERQNWETLLINGQKKVGTYYVIDNEAIKSEVASYLNLDQNIIAGIKLNSGEEMISAIQNDPYAIGFCKVSSILDVNNQNIAQGIKFLPIDKNGNGKIDYSENIYADLNTFLRGVWIGKYPKDLCKNIYSIAPLKPSNESEIAFLAWVLTNGQQYLNPNGYSDLASNQRQASIDRLYDKKIAVKTTTSRSILPIAILIIAGCIVLFIVVDSTIQRFRFKKNLIIDTPLASSPFFNEKSLIAPEGLYFDKSHTWAFMEKDGAVGVGIDDFLLHVTGPITRIKMKEPGEKIKKGEPFLTIIQDGKQLNLKAPISGTIKSQNKKLISNASLINQSPYNEGWIYTIEPTNWLRDTQFLIFANGYREWLKMEFLHIKDFLAIAIRTSPTELVLQDGGEIKDGILKDLKPEIWEDFQTHFIDNSL